MCTNFILDLQKGFPIYEVLPLISPQIYQSYIGTVPQKRAKSRTEGLDGGISISDKWPYFIVISD